MFATSAVNPGVTTNGLFMGGGPSFFLTQTIAVIIVSAYCFLISYAMLWVINLITPVKTTIAHEELGLDESLHGELAYEKDSL